MSKDIDFRLFAFLNITLGVMLTFAAAVVPHFTAGYTLRLDVLLIGLLPYLVYGSFLNVVRGGALLVSGALVFGMDLGVKIPERFLDYTGYAGNAVFYAPLVSALLAAVILAFAARRENRWEGETTPPENSGH